MAEIMYPAEQLLKACNDFKAERRAEIKKKLDAQVDYVMTWGLFKRICNGRWKAFSSWQECAAWCDKQYHFWGWHHPKWYGGIQAERVDRLADLARHCIESTNDCRQQCIRLSADDLKDIGPWL